MLRKALFTLALVVSACSAGDESAALDEIAVSDETIEEFCSDFAAVICDNERSCCSKGGEADCEYFEGVACVIEIQSAIRDGVEFHLASAEAYRDTVAARGRDCHSYPGSLPHGVDKPVDREIGEICSDPGGYWKYPSGCVNSYCAYDDEASEYLCTAFKTTGDECQDDEECGPGAACPHVSYGTEKVCAPTVGEGESCTDDECAKGLWCDWDLDICVPADQPAGASCADYNGCDGFCDETTNTCAACKTDEDCPGTECWDGTCSDHSVNNQDGTDGYYCID